MSGTELTPSTKEQAMRARDFDRIRRLAYDHCGVDLAGKQILVAARLGKKVRELGLSSFEEYCEHVQHDTSGGAFTAMIDALTTNHTSFFREIRHFDFLRDVILPGLPASVPISIWSAACSSGEEPYSIAFGLIEALGAAAFSRVSITATDISTRVLKKAQDGLYPASTLTGLPATMLQSYLLKGTGEYADQCLVKREVRALIEFRQLNLLDDCSAVGPFQVIFCRNVMIYFDQQTQQAVVNHLISRLAPGGYLLIGHAESLNGIDHPLKYVTSATYRMPGSPGTASSTRKTRSSRETS